MASYYVYSGAGGTADGSSWTNAFTSLKTAMESPRAAGDIFYVADDHTQTTASAFTITSAGTEANPQKVYCVRRTGGSVPPVSADLRTTAQINTTVASNISLAGSVGECYGIQFSAGSSTSLALLNVSSTSGRTWRMVNCLLKLGNSGNSSRIVTPAAGGALAVLENCTLQFGSVNQGIAPIGRMVARNCTLAGSVPNSLFALGTSTSSIFCEGCDLSLVAGASKFMFLGTTSTSSSAVLKDCKLGTPVSVLTGSIPGSGCLEFTLIRCDSGDTNYRTEKYNYAGGQTTETTIVRSGGASDGVTPISWLIGQSVSNSLVYESLPITVWNETLGSVTVTIEGIWGLGSTPDNASIWMECQYLGTSGFPIASKATSGKADGLASASSYAAGSGTWGGSTTKFAMSCTFTPAERGPITIVIKTSSSVATYYIDPKPVIT